MDALVDPDSLRDCSSISFHEETRTIPQDEFESVAEEVDSHAVVGVTNDDGDVLLMNDGSHGWTLLAFPVKSGEDWTAVASQEAERLLNIPVILEEVERVRRIGFRSASDGGQDTTMYNVVFRASAHGDPVEGKAQSKNNGEPTLGWFEEVPDEQTGETADDIRIFVPN